MQKLGTSTEVSVIGAFGTRAGYLLILTEWNLYSMAPWHALSNHFSILFNYFRERTDHDEEVYSQSHVSGNTSSTCLPSLGDNS
jgi:hypothetical protein